METSEQRWPPLLSWLKSSKNTLETLPRPRKIFIASDSDEVIDEFVSFFGKDTVSFNPFLFDFFSIFVKALDLFPFMFIHEVHSVIFIFQSYISTTFSKMYSVYFKNKLKLKGVQRKNYFQCLSRFVLIQCFHFWPKTRQLIATKYGKVQRCLIFFKTEDA